MNKILRQFLFYFLFTLSSLGHAADRADYTEFLNRLGFEDYSAEAAATLQTPNVNEVAKVVLKDTVERYQVVNVARELTLDIVEESFDRIQDPVIQERILNLAVYLLEPHAFIANEPLPTNIDQIKKAEPFTVARYNFLQKKIVERYQDERATLLAAMIDLAPSKDVLEEDRRLKVYLRSKYQDPGLQQTRFWGRALAAAIVKHGRTHNLPELETRLSQKLLSKGLWLSNFISSTVKYKNDNGEIVTVKIANGDIVNEYAKGSESYFITLGVEPSSPADRAFAQKQNLLGKKRLVPFYLMPDAERDLLEKARERQPLTLTEKTHYAFLQNEPPSNGYSHVGLLEVRTDPSTGIEMPWVWDVYPGLGIGGVRFQGLEGFSYPEKFRSIGFVHYSPTKFYRHYQKTMRYRGYRSAVWKSWGARIDEEGDIVEDKSKTYVWQTLISSSEVTRLQSFPESAAERWYSQEIIPRVIKTMKTYLVSKEALAFALNFANIQNAAYCSQLIVLAFLQGVNVDAQASFDQYPALLSTLEKFHDSIGYYVKHGERVIAPSGFAWQSQLVQSHAMVHHDKKVLPKSGARLLDPVRQRLTTTPFPEPSALQPPPENLNEFYEDAH